MQNFEEFKKVIDEIESSRAFEIDSEAFKLENSFKVLISNFSYLRNVIQKVPVFDVRQRQEKEKFMIEATRCFVNYLSSAGAFKDHTRRYIRKLYDSTEDALDGEYQDKVNKEFLKDPLARFIEALRNIYCHEEIPPVGILTREKDGKFVSRFVLFTKDLDPESDYFKPEARKYLKRLSEEEVDILDLSEKYLYKTIFPWIMQKQNQAHEDEFDKLEELKQKARKLMEDIKY